MAGIGLSEFLDFVEATPSAHVTGPKAVMLAGKNNYLWNDAFEDENAKKIQGGENIVGHAIFKGNGSYQEVSHGQVRTWTNPQLLKRLTSNWRQAEGHMSFFDGEILNNEKLRFGGSNPDVKYEVYVDLMSTKEAPMWVSIADGVEASMFRKPNTTTMESNPAVGAQPYSLGVFMNEFANGLPVATTGTWTTVEGLDPTSADLNNQFSPVAYVGNAGVAPYSQKGYDSVAVDNAGNIIGRMDELFMRLEYRPPQMFKEYYETPSLKKQKIITSLKGRAAFMNLCRAGNDRFIAGPQDPSVPDPVFRGIPVKWVDSMDTAEWYNNGAGDLTTEKLADLVGPRFLFPNFNYLYPVVHTERYFYKDTRMRDILVPDAWVIRVALWWNWMCTSRKHQGILGPAGDLYYV